MKSIVISVNPEHALNILNGNKTLELRKSVPKGFVGWVYGYVTKGGEILYDGKKTYLGHGDYDETWWILNGTIPFRFWFDEYDKYTDVSDCGMTSCGMECENDFTYKLYDLDDELEKLCLTYNEVYLYGKGKDLYAWHIKKLEVFDKPMMLSEFYGDFVYIDTDEHGRQHNPIHLPIPVKRPPQSWQYAYILGAK